MADPTNEIEAIYNSLFRKIFGYLVYRLFRKDLAEDAASAVFLKLVEHFPKLKGKSQVEIRNWLYGTASNVAAAFLRDDRRQLKIMTELANAKHGGWVVNSDQVGRLDWPVLYQAIGKLKQKHQDIIVLRYFQGLETSEIADVLGLGHVTVRVSLMRAIRKLRRKLGKPFGDSAVQH